MFSTVTPVFHDFLQQETLRLSTNYLSSAVRQPERSLAEKCRAWLHRDFADNSESRIRPALRVIFSGAWHTARHRRPAPVNSNIYLNKRHH